MCNLFKEKYVWSFWDSWQIFGLIDNPVFSESLLLSL